jgi:hypothetical protein
LRLQKTFLDRVPKFTSIPGITGMPKLPTAVPAFLGLALLAGAVTWCIQRIDTTFDTFSEDYISSAALTAVKKHNTAEAAELLLRFHLEHSGKMTAEHLLMLGQYLSMCAAEALQTKDYSTAITYLEKVSNDCPQYSTAQTQIRYLKEHGLTATAPVQSVTLTAAGAAPAASAAPAAPVAPVAAETASVVNQTTEEAANSPTSKTAAAASVDLVAPGSESSRAVEFSANENRQINRSATTNSSELKDGQILLSTPPVVPQVITSDVQETKLQTSVPIWQRFSRGIATSKNRASGGTVSNASTANANAVSRANLKSDDQTRQSVRGNEAGTLIEPEIRGDTGSRGDVGGAGAGATGSTGETKNFSGATANNSPGRSVIPPAMTEASARKTTENERDKPKVSGFFIDGKQVTGDSKSLEPEKSPEKVTESARRAGPKSRFSEGQKSYNPDDISRYNELLANYFSQHDASSQKSTDKHGDGAEPPSFQEWISKGKPGFR